MKESWDLILCAIVFTLVVMFASYKVGRKYEQWTWERTIPSEMAKLCEECAGLIHER